MRQKFLAVIAFNIYALFLISAFQDNTVYLFETSLMVEEMILRKFNPADWGWGNHYIWRLFAGVIVTVVVSFLAGAIAKKDGAKVAAVANIPSVIIWVVMIYLLTFAHVELEASVLSRK